MGFTSSLRRLVTAPSAICKTFLINYRQDSISFRAAPPYQSPASDLFSPCFCPFVRQDEGEFNSELERAFLQPAIICRLTRSRTRFGSRDSSHVPRDGTQEGEGETEREREREREREGGRTHARFACGGKNRDATSLSRDCLSPSCRRIKHAAGEFRIPR